MTIPTPILISRDDEIQQVTLSTERKPLEIESVQQEHPYGLMAAMVALWLLLLLRATRLPVPVDLAFALLLGVGSYLRFRSLKIGYRLDVLTILASVLGILYGLPYKIVYHATGNFWFLLSGVLIAVITGSLFGNKEEVEQHPNDPIAVSFLAMFVFGNLITMFISYLFLHA